MNEILIVGSVALDSVKTPKRAVKEVLGGSATYAALSASFFSRVKILSVAGEDFPPTYIDFFQARNIDTRGLKIQKGRTFRWQGEYTRDFSDAITRKTELNVLSRFKADVPKEFRRCAFVFLANVNPELQLSVIKQMQRPRLLIADTMDFWIKNRRYALNKVMSKVDIFLLNESEARLFADEQNLYKCARKILSRGPRLVSIKKGENGSFLYTKELIFFAPAYPLENIVDPTGAGDSFAGGLIGHIARAGKVNEFVLKQAVIYGNLMASFAVEDFSVNGLKNITAGKITRRYNKLKKLVLF
jgi:sugar/nucleoside kinase (ribokinase family)